MCRRWKETSFLNVGADCGLTIAGFYYVCLNRQSGSVSGLYFDPTSTPYQELSLSPHTKPGAGGLSFGSFAVC